MSLSIIIEDKVFSRFLILSVEKLSSSSLNVLILLLIRLKVLLFNKLLSLIILILEKEYKSPSVILK